MEKFIASMLCLMFLMFTVSVERSFIAKPDCITLGQGDSGVPTMVQATLTIVPEIALITPFNLQPFDYGSQVTGVFADNKRINFKNYSITCNRYRHKISTGIGKYKQHEHPLHYDPGSVNEVKRA